jgi:hypothetical protein
MAANTLRTAGLVIAGLALTALPAFADHDRSSHRDGHSSDRAVEHARSVDSGRVVSRAEVVGRAAPRAVAPRTIAPRYYNNGRAYYYSPRIIRPAIINVVPYRPYFYHYRPAISFYYGAGIYPYSYEVPPASYLSVAPGRLYGGVRITDAPRDAQVFVDGYYIGVVDDFDGVFQHMNLEAGPHHIEVVEQGFEPVAFDVNVQPGQTTTFRADMQPAQQ